MLTGTTVRLTRSWLIGYCTLGLALALLPWLCFKNMTFPACYILFPLSFAPWTLIFVYVCCINEVAGRSAQKKFYWVHCETAGLLALILSAFIMQVWVLLGVYIECTTLGPNYPFPNYVSITSTTLVSTLASFRLACNASTTFITKSAKISSCLAKGSLLAIGLNAAIICCILYGIVCSSTESTIQGGLIACNIGQGIGYIFCFISLNKLVLTIKLPSSVSEDSR
jgi:hypothetical protein